MSAEEHKALIRRIADEVFTQHNPDAVDELYAVDFVNHSPGAGQTPDRDGIKRATAQQRAAGSDLKEVLEDLVVEGNTVVERYTMRFTHTMELTGPTGPIPPTGTVVTIPGIAIFRVRDGQVVERWANLDMLGAFQQLGAIPTPAPTPA